MSRSVNQYYIIYERDEKRGYIASAPAIPGCVVYGKTLQEAHKNIRLAIKDCLEVIREFHQRPPKETVQPKAVRKFSFVSVSEYAKT
ncbi:MAG: type II toxin-antitoxin system HicB family antitoxin [Candidatus Ryanbacteria bacterium]|nr:type II toxin-antitoxin system HicB family antitoxin [Candidatus Ryanbacteria bacterium]